MQNHRHRGQVGSSSSLSQAEDVILPMPGLQLLRRSTPTVHHASQHPPGNRRRSRPANTPSLWTTHGHPLSRVYSASVWLFNEHWVRSPSPHDNVPQHYRWRHSRLGNLWRGTVRTDPTDAPLFHRHHGDPLRSYCEDDREVLWCVSDRRTVSGLYPTETVHGHSTRPPSRTFQIHPTPVSSHVPESKALRWRSTQPTSLPHGSHQHHDNTVAGRPLFVNPSHTGTGFVQVGCSRSSATVPGSDLRRRAWLLKHRSIFFSSNCRRTTAMLYNVHLLNFIFTCVKLFNFLVKSCVQTLLFIN